MGLQIFSMESEFMIKACNLHVAMEAIQSLAGQETIRKENFSGMTSNDHFMYVDAEKYLKANTFFETMEAWRWIFEADENGNAIDPDFMGENLGDEDLLFEAISPYVEHGSFIQVYSVDEEQVWKDRFLM